MQESKYGKMSEENLTAIIKRGYLILSPFPVLGLGLLILAVALVNAEIFHIAAGILGALLVLMGILGFIVHWFAPAIERAEDEAEID